MSARSDRALALLPGRGCYPADREGSAGVETELVGVAMKERTGVLNRFQSFFVSQGIRSSLNAGALVQQAFEGSSASSSMPSASILP